MTESKALAELKIHNRPCPNSFEAIKWYFALWGANSKMCVCKFCGCLLVGGLYYIGNRVQIEPGGKYEKCIRPVKKTSLPFSPLWPIKIAKMGFGKQFVLGWKIIGRMEIQVVLMLITVC